ncbi:MAG: ATP-binding cassette domain-containing protein [Chloroflexi bacterium]|nr:ATP-binding cassette domain-containing protein [Chloroflexota bacterium]
MSEPAITVDGLVKRYSGSDKNAVDGISFTVESGSFFTLLGPNGAGKTTTISILTTTLAPTGGVACVAGFDVRRDASAVRQRVGIIFQNHSLDQNLTAEENIRLHAVMYGIVPWRPLYRLMPEEYRARVDELAGLLGIGDEIFKPVRTYSGGMKRKLEIVRSLMHRPQILFLDEPSAGLDAASRRALWAYLKDVREKSGTTVFLTTHYLEEAEDCDRVCIIAKGKIVALGSPAEVKSTVAAAHTPSLEDAYLAIVERS